jgi:SMI1 / KNR4 family (SUKH-1)
MSDFNWQSFLKVWSVEFLESVSDEDYPQLKNARQAEWLGFPPAVEAQILEVENRLGITLPPSYRAFLKVANGWQYPSSFVERLLSVEELDWHFARHPEQVRAWIKAMHPLRKRPAPIPMDRYLKYGDEMNPLLVPLDFLKATLEISIFDDGIYLLNPKVINEDGEWEAWFFAEWIPGANRYPSFQAMMEAEHQLFLESDHLGDDDDEDLD